MMNKKATRHFGFPSIILALLALAAWGALAACSLDTYEPKENEVKVTISGLGDKAVLARESLGAEKARGFAASWVKVAVIDGDGAQTGSGSLALENGVWEGYVQLSGPGAMTFIVSAGTAADQVSWMGSGAMTVGGKGQEITVTVTVPALGAKGPAGGSIFYDKGSYSNGWRYLEASPTDTAATASVSDNGYRLWAAQTTYVVGNTYAGIGYGKENTDWIQAAGNATMYPAAWYCAELECGGAADWFLPSWDELAEMRKVIGHAGFHVEYQGAFWSSTERTALDGGTDAAYYVYTDAYKTTKGPALKTNADVYVKAARRF